LILSERANCAAEVLRSGGFAPEKLREGGFWRRVESDPILGWSAKHRTGKSGALAGWKALESLPYWRAGAATFSAVSISTTQRGEALFGGDQFLVNLKSLLRDFGDEFPVGRQFFGEIVQVQFGLHGLAAEFSDFGFDGFDGFHVALSPAGRIPPVAL
jgi:hypothetical protein